MNSVKNRNMEKKFLIYFLLFINSVTSQTVQEIIASIEELIEESNHFTYPNNYNEFNTSKSVKSKWYGSFDFIIIGAGTAGTTLAHRLSENPNWNILLLEAGGNESLASDVPIMSRYLQFSHFNWGYLSIPQTTCCLGMINKQCNVPRGKVLGGSSTINSMMYIRGYRKEFDEWAAAGNPGWSYADVLPYFIKSENGSFTENYDPEYHGNNGPLHVEHVRHFSEFSQKFLDANVELGRKILDYNAREQMGYSRLQATTINGRRCSGNKAYLTPVLSRKNLKVLTGAFVTKINVSKYPVKAWGVEFIYENTTYIASVLKEVILSAGAIGSPKILMHSGIGPKEHLEQFGINVVADLPVGRNLHDHFFLLSPVQTNFFDPAIGKMEEMVAEYLNGTGFLTAPAETEAIGFINTLNRTTGFSDIEEYIRPFYNLSDGLFQKLYNYEDKIYNEFIEPYKPYATVILQVLFYPESRGSVTLRSSDVFDHPNIDLNYFSESEDVEVFVRGVKDIKTIISTSPFNNTAKLLRNPLSDCPFDFDSDDYLRCMIRHMASTLYHQSGTCKMAPRNDSTAVVNSNLQVHGVEGLRVIDVSVIPFPLGGHTNGPTFMIAEKGSDIIKEAWKIQ